MSHGPLDDDAVESYREAGAVLVEAMNEAREMVEPGRSQLEVAEWVEDFVRERGAGLAFRSTSASTRRPHTPPPAATTTRRSARRWCVSTSASTSTATSPTRR
jgi:Methionine aminopeptidase